MATLPKLTCLRCGHTWIPRMCGADGEVLRPATCANQRCRSPWWDKPRRKPKGETSQVSFPAQSLPRRDSK